MIVDKVLTWLANRWMKKNLTQENFTAWACGFWDWITDRNIRRALWEISKFCIVNVIEEVKKQHKKLKDEKNNANSPESPCA